MSIDRPAGKHESWRLQVERPAALCVSSTFVVVAGGSGCVLLFAARTLTFRAALPRAGVHTNPKDLAAAVAPTPGHENPDACCVAMSASEAFVTVIYSDFSLTVWDIRSVSKVCPLVLVLWTHAALTGHAMPRVLQVCCALQHGYCFTTWAVDNCIQSVRQMIRASVQWLVCCSVLRADCCCAQGSACMLAGVFVAACWWRIAAALKAACALQIQKKRSLAGHQACIWAAALSPCALPMMRAASLTSRIPADQGARVFATASQDASICLWSSGSRAVPAAPASVWSCLHNPLVLLLAKSSTTYLFRC